MSFTDWDKRLVAFNSPQIGDIVHWGRSIKDGAPGVGTGNWRRGGRGILKYISPDGTLSKKGRKEASKLLRSRDPKKQEVAYKLLDRVNPNSSNNQEERKETDIDTTLYGKKEKEKGQIAGLGLDRSIRKQARSMTEQELNDAIKRIDLEKKYSDLMKQQNKTIISTGAEVVGNMFRRSFENIGQQLLTYGIGTAVNKVAKKEVVNPKKGQKDK